MFETNSDFSGIWISSFLIIGQSGFVPDFTITAFEGDYSIQVNRTTEIDTDGDGLIDDAIVCTVVETVINVIDPDEMDVDVMTGGEICNYLDDNGIIQSTPDGYIQLDNFTGGTPPYTYTWLNSEGVIIEEVLSGGIATLEDFDNDGVLDDLDYLGTGLYTLNVLDANDCPFQVNVLLEGSRSFIK